MGFKLDHLVPEGSIRHTMRGIVLAPSVDPQPVVLLLKHAGKKNERFTKQINNARAKGNTDEKTTVAIFSRTIVEGWEHVYNAEGKPVEFSPEQCEELLLGLIDAGRHESVIEAFDKASDPNPFARRDDLGKG